MCISNRNYSHTYPSSPWYWAHGLVRGLQSLVGEQRGFLVHSVRSFGGHHKLAGSIGVPVRSGDPKWRCCECLEGGALSRVKSFEATMVSGEKPEMPSSGLVIPLFDASMMRLSFDPIWLV
jgi:hypothetical protein